MAEEPLLSSSWYRVAAIRPQLRQHAEIHRHTYRGEDWYVLQDHSSGRFHRFRPEAYYLIGQMDGTRTVDQIWTAACARFGDDVPTQDEVISLLSQLYRADVLRSDVIPDIADLHERSREIRRRELIGYIRSPLSLRFPLLDPDRFLNRTRSLVDPLFGWPGAVVWCGIVIWAVVLAATNLDALTSGITDRVMSTQNLYLLALIYPVVKVFHEFGHAYAVKRWGGEVHEMGLMLLVFVPIPYVDASSASGYPRKGRRILVGAAGILVELFLASLATIAWHEVEPGTVRAVAFNVIVIASVSTLLFNGNPLLRYDAYYVLSDFLETPNLGTRANSYLGYLLQRYVVGVEDAEDPSHSPSEARWLAVYGVAAAIYRAFIIVAIVLVAASRFFFVGVLIAAWAVASIVIAPIFKGVKQLTDNPRLFEVRGRIVAAVAAAVLLVAVLTLVVPVPMFTVAEGVVWAPEDSRVRAGADGTVEALAVPAGARVTAGELLIRCSNPALVADVGDLEARLREVEARHRAAQSASRTDADILRKEVEKVTAELARTQERVAGLAVSSPADGRFLLARPADLPGRFVSRGSDLGYVVDFSDVTVRVLVAQADADRVRTDTRRVEARIAENVSRVIAGRITREVPAASQELPSPVLSLEGGGTIALDPQSRDRAESFERHFQFEVVLEDATIRRVGERVFVRFVHSPEPVGFRWYRAARRMLLKRFDI